MSETRHLSDARALLGDEYYLSRDEWSTWPAPPFHDLETGGSAALCLNCGLTPVSRACPSCPRISVRLFRQWRDQPRLPDSRWARLRSVFERRGA